MDLGESLKTRIEAGLEAAVTKYFDRDFDGHVTVSPNGHETEIDCNIHLPSGIILQSTGKAEDPYVALDEALNKIEKRVRRYKRRLQDHHKNGQTPFPSHPRPPAARAPRPRPPVRPAQAQGGAPARPLGPVQHLAPQDSSEYGAIESKETETNLAKNGGDTK